MNVRGIGRSTFDNHQSQYLQPVIYSTWQTTQQEMFQELSRMGGGLVIGGDGRSDSPGHCAKYGSYSTMELRLGKIIDVPLVQVLVLLGSVFTSLV